MVVKPAPWMTRSTARIFSSARVAILVEDGDRRRQITEGDMIAAQRLQRQIGIDHLVVGVGIEKLDRLVVQHFAQQAR